MIDLRIITDIKNGSKGKCDAEESTIEEIAMMIALLEKYKQNIQNNFNELSDFEFNTGMTKFKKEAEK